MRKFYITTFKKIVLEWCFWVFYNLVKKLFVYLSILECNIIVDDIDEIFDLVDELLRVYK